MKTALITGASRGLGRAIALRLARDGHHVLINYVHRKDAAEDVASQIAAAGGSASLCAFDVRDRSAVQAALAAVQAERSIDILVNNAGIHQDGPFPSMQPTAWEDVTRLTLDGFFNVTQPLVMPMVTARFGRIVNITSISGLIGNRGQVNYSAAKAGLIGATRSLSLEVAKRGVTVNAVAPGLIETEMVSDELAKKLKSEIPMRRLGKPEEVAGVVSFLAGDDAAYVTGQVISVNGGLI